MNTEELKECSDMQLLNELNKRLSLGQIIGYHSKNDIDKEQVMICLKNEDDNDAFFLYLNKGQMTSLITNFKNQMDKMRNKNYEENK